MRPDAPALAVGNGVGADETLEEARTSGIIAGSLTTAIALDRAAGTVRRLSRGGLGLAPVRGVDVAHVERIAASLVAGGLRVASLRDAAAMRWSKLLANLLGNATSAILDVDPVDVYRDPMLFDVERRQCRARRWRSCATCT